MSALVDQSKQKKTAYTLEEASHLTKIGSFTLKMYLKSFPSHIGILKNQSDSQILNTSIPVLEQIRDLYRSGQSTEEIRSNLTSLIINNATKDYKKSDSSKTHVIKALVEQRDQLETIRDEQIKFQKLNNKRIDQKEEYFQTKLQEVDNKSQASFNHCLEKIESFENNDQQNYQNKIFEFETKLKASMQEQINMESKKVHDDVLAKVKLAWEKQQQNNQGKIDKLSDKINRWEPLFRSIIEQQVEHKLEIQSLQKYQTQIDDLKQQIDNHKHDNFFTKIKSFFSSL